MSLALVKDEDSWEEPIEFTPYEFTQWAVQHKGQPIDLDSRPWLWHPYNLPFCPSVTKAGRERLRRRILFVFGRQSEKTVEENAEVIDALGRRVPIKDVKVGDHLATLAEDGSSMTSGPVTWKSRRYEKECVRITTALGHVLDLGVTHPVRQWERWTPSGDLRVGDRVASVRELADAQGEAQEDDLVTFLGLMLGDGGMISQVGFTQDRGSPALALMRDICRRRGWAYREYAKKGTNSVDLRFNRSSGAAEFLGGLGLLGLGSEAKFVPGAFLRLPRHQVRMLVEAMWACDGCIRGSGSRVEAVYATISPVLARQMQSLLWRLGVPTRIRENVPVAYRGTSKRAYLVTVRTSEGLLRFSAEVAVPGKPMPPLPPTRNDNRDTYPPEVSADIRAVADSVRPTRDGGASALYRSGLRRKTKYPLSRRKLREYVDYFRANGFDAKGTDRLAAHVDTDVLWDRIVSVEPLGVRWCYDLEVENTHNFVVAGVVTHNSTSLGNLLISSSNLTPYQRALYVTASNPQMLEFSDERLRAVIEDSPILRDLSGANSKANKQIQNVTTKRWSNGSKIVLRSVFRSADRVRGIPTDVLACDELQDIYIDELPVIEETTRACQLEDGDLRIYAGTPKTFDNSIEFYWSRRSTQNEWMIRCSGCNHWNAVEVGNIRPEGLCCIKCDRELDPVRNGEWVRFGAEDAEWEGFRVPQPIVEYVYRAKTEMFWRKWDTLVQKVINYPRAKLENEVLARSYDSGTKPVTYQQVRRCAIPEKSLMTTATSTFRQTPKWSGTDWGTGDASYTIHSIWYYDAGGRFQLAYAKKYVGREADPEWAVEDIIRTDREFGVRRLGCDWGFGFESNSKLVKAFGADKVKQYHHTDGQSKLVNYDPDRNVYTTHRSRVMALAFELIKRGPVSGGAGFVNWEQFETFAADILSIYSEYSKLRRQIVYDHPRGVPDDFFHTMVYALLASMLDHRRNDLITATS